MTTTQLLFKFRRLHPKATAVQTWMFGLLASFAHLHFAWPSVGKIAEQGGFKTLASVEKVLGQLEELGAIEARAGKDRQGRPVEGWYIAVADQTEEKKVRKTDRSPWVKPQHDDVDAGASEFGGGDDQEPEAAPGSMLAPIAAVPTYQPPCELEVAVGNTSWMQWFVKRHFGLRDLEDVGPFLRATEARDIQRGGSAKSAYITLKRMYDAESKVRVDSYYDDPATKARFLREQA